MENDADLVPVTLLFYCVLLAKGEILLAVNISERVDH
jgi:hypothetical protein